MIDRTLLSFPSPLLPFHASPPRYTIAFNDGEVVEIGYDAQKMRRHPSAASSTNAVYVPGDPVQFRFDGKWHSGKVTQVAPGWDEAEIYDATATRTTSTKPPPQKVAAATGATGTTDAATSVTGPATGTTDAATGATGPVAENGGKSGTDLVDLVLNSGADRASTGPAAPPRRAPAKTKMHANLVDRILDTDFKVASEPDMTVAATGGGGGATGGATGLGGTTMVLSPTYTLHKTQDTKDSHTLVHSLTHSNYPEATGGTGCTGGDDGSEVDANGVAAHGNSMLKDIKASGQASAAFEAAEGKSRQAAQTKNDLEIKSEENVQRAQTMERKAAEHAARVQRQKAKIAQAQQEATAAARKRAKAKQQVAAAAAMEAAEIAEAKKAKQNKERLNIAETKLRSGIAKSKNMVRLVDAQVDAENAKADDAAASLEKLGAAKLETSRNVKAVTKVLATATRLHAEGQAKVEAGSKLVSQALKIMEEKNPVMKAARESEAALLGKMAAKAAAKAAAELMVAKATTAKKKLQSEIKPMIEHSTSVRKEASKAATAEATAVLRNSEASKAKDDATRAAEEADGEAKDADLNAKKSEQKAFAAATEASNDAKEARVAEHSAAEAEALKSTTEDAAKAAKADAEHLKVEEAKKDDAAKAKKKSVEVEEKEEIAAEKAVAKAQAKANEEANRKAAMKRVEEENMADREDDAAGVAEKEANVKAEDEVRSAKKTNNAGVTAQLLKSATVAKGVEEVL